MGSLGSGSAIQDQSLTVRTDRWIPYTGLDCSFGVGCFYFFFFPQLFSNFSWPNALFGMVQIRTTSFASGTGAKLLKDG